MNNTLNITRLLTIISKGLNIANKVIPIYQDTKPLIKNIKNISNSLVAQTNEHNNKIKEEKKEEPIKSSSISNNPKFFI